MSGVWFLGYTNNQGVHIMKPKNFPARKLRRQLIAQFKDPIDHQKELSQARKIRTKKSKLN